MDWHSWDSHCNTVRYDCRENGHTAISETRRKKHKHLRWHCVLFRSVLGLSLAVVTKLQLGAERKVVSVIPGHAYFLRNVELILARYEDPFSWELGRTLRKSKYPIPARSKDRCMRVSVDGRPTAVQGRRQEIWTSPVNW